MENKISRCITFVLGILASLIVFGCTRDGGEEMYKPNMNQLISAVEKSDLEKVKRLIDRGADPNIVLQDGVTPMNVAIVHQKFEILKALIEKGGDPNLAITNKGKKLIFSSIVPGKLEYLKVLVDAGAEVNVLNGPYGSPLKLSMSLNQYDIALYLLKNGADPLLGLDDVQILKTYFCEEDRWDNKQRIHDKLLTFQLIAEKIPELKVIECN